MEEVLRHIIFIKICPARKENVFEISGNRFWLSQKKMKYTIHKYFHDFRLFKTEYIYYCENCINDISPIVIYFWTLNLQHICTVLKILLF